MSTRLPASDTYEERKRRNTICFKPDYSPADLRVQVGYGVWPRFAYIQLRRMMSSLYPLYF